MRILAAIAILASCAWAQSPASTSVWCAETTQRGPTLPCALLLEPALTIGSPRRAATGAMWAPTDVVAFPVRRTPVRYALMTELRQTRECEGLRATFMVSANPPARSSAALTLPVPVVAAIHGRALVTRTETVGSPPPFSHLASPPR